MTGPRPCSHPILGSVSWEPQPSTEWLGVPQCQPVDLGGDQVGVSVAVGRGQGSPGFSAFSFPYPNGQCRMQGSGRGGSISTFERGYRGGHMPVFSGFLRQNFCRSEKFGRLETSLGPLHSQSLSQGSFLSNGVSCFSQGFHAQRRLGGVYRSPGRLFPYPDSSKGPEISEVFLERENFSVPGSSLRSGSGTVAVHSGFPGVSEGPQVRRDQDQNVLRRLAHSSSIATTMPGTYQQSPFSVFPTGICSEPGKVRTHPLSAVCLSGSDVQHDNLAMQSISGSHSQTESSVRLSYGLSSSFSQTLGFSSGFDGVFSSPALARTSPQKTTPASVPVSMASEVRPLEHVNSSGTVVQDCGMSVDSGFVANPRCSHYSSSSSSDLVHGRFERGMGGTCRRSFSLGDLDQASGELAHQPARARSSSSISLRVSPESQRETRSPQNRQHNSSVLSEPTRGCKNPVSVSTIRESPSLVQIEIHCSHGKVCSGQTEHPSGLSKSVPHGSKLRMDSGSFSSGTHLADVVQTSDRSVCLSVQQTPSSVRVSSARPGSMGGRCTVDQLGKSSGLRFSSHSSAGESHKEDKGRSSKSHSDRPFLARSGVVSGPSSSLTHSSSTVVREKRVSSATKVRDSSREPGNLAPSNMANMREALRAQGATSTVAALVSSSHRKGTQSVYSSHWKKWESWCRDKNIDPISPGRMDLANFLGDLSKVDKLSASTIRVHRSAICSTLSLMGGPSFSDDPILRSVSRAVSLAEAAVPKRAPAWDLFLVLDHLKGSPYEPMSSSSLQHLTLKTAFLVALASGRRSSEVHAFSGNPKDYSFEPNGGISLNFLTEFIAKNQIPGSMSPTVMINKLFREKTDHSDRLLCPVRALRYYLRRTKESRSDRRRLFISFNLKYKKDIKKQTFARWLKTVIKEAYARPERELIRFNPRPHEIRAWSASVALTNDVSLRTF